MSLRATTSALRPLSRVSARAVRHTAANGGKPKQQQQRLITIRSNPEPVQSPNAGIKFGLSTTAAIVVVAGIVFKYGESKNKHAKGGKHDAHKAKEEEQPKVPTTIAEKTVEAAETSAASSSTDEPEEDQSQEAAFNPETGEINWDCPCLGGMAHGPCGEQFKAAFSCFVFSEQEPKGQDCIEHFRAMQECFKKHPDIYGEDELEEEDEDSALVRAAEEALRD